MATKYSTRKTLETERQRRHPIFAGRKKEVSFRWNLGIYLLMQLIDWPLLEVVLLLIGLTNTKTSYDPLRRDQSSDRLPAQCAHQKIVYVAKMNLLCGTHILYTNNSVQVHACIRN
jgi:hypothetical protein